MTANEDEGEAKINALLGAYLIVAAADGDVAAPEMDRFSQTIHEMLPQLGLSSAGLTRRVENALHLFATRPGRSRDDALAAIAGFREDETMREAIIALARIAAVADKALEPQEEYALREIADVLGLPPDRF